VRCGCGDQAVRNQWIAHHLRAGQSERMSVSDVGCVERCADSSVWSAHIVTRVIETTTGERSGFRFRPVCGNEQVHRVTVELNHGEHVQTKLESLAIVALVVGDVSKRYETIEFRKVRGPTLLFGDQQRLEVSVHTHA
jgi:hypothetical protein